MKRNNRKNSNNDDNNDGNEYSDEEAAELGKKFIHSSVIFLTLSQAIRGDSKPGENVFSDICYQITGNRKDQPLTEALPLIMQKVIDHCQESLAMSTDGDTRI